MYADVRDAAGVSSIDVEASDLRSLVDRLKDKSPSALATLLEKSKDDPDALVILLNGMNVGRRDLRTVILKEGDEVALFPPVSGG